MSISTRPSIEDHTFAERQIGRRRLLAAAGLPTAALLSTGLFAASAQAATPADGAPGTAQVTIAELRAMTSRPASALYLVTDRGMEGLFGYDPDDMTSSDNTGTVLVTAGGARIKRAFAGPVNVRWFGAKGDNATDDTVAICAAVGVAQTPPVDGSNQGRELYLPAGTYLISEPITLSPRPTLRISGDGADESYISVHPSAGQMSAMIQFSSAEKAPRFEFSDFSLNCKGGGRANFGVDGQNLNHGRFHNMWIIYSAQAGIRIAKGLYTTITSCRFVGNTGAGILLGPGEVNVVSIVDSIWSSTGVGIDIRSEPTQQVRISGCCIEGCPDEAIKVTSTVRALDISDNYFEANNKAANPGKKAYAHILVDSGNQTGPIRVASNHVWMNFPTDRPNSLVACYSGLGAVRVTDNRIVRGGTHQSSSAVVRTATGVAPGNLSVSGNYLEHFSDDLPCSSLVVDDLAGGLTQLHQASIEGVVRANYATPLVRFKPVSRPAQGTWRKAKTTYRLHDVWELASAAVAGEWGFSVDLDDHPELAGKYVYFACWAKASDTDTAVVLSTSQLGPQDADSAKDTDWHVVSYVDQLPGSGAVTFSIAKASASAASTVSIAHPVLSEVGVRYDDQDAA